MPLAREEIQAYVRARQLRPSTEQRWLDLAPADAAAVLALAAPLRLGDNQLGDLLDALEDIAARRRATPAAVLQDPAVRQVLGRELGRSDRIKALKGCLRRMRYPQLSAALDRLALLSGQLNLPSGVRLEFPEFLEGDAVTVTVRASSAAELRAKLARLVAATDSAQCEEMFAILGGAE